MSAEYDTRRDRSGTGTGVGTNTDTGIRDHDHVHDRDDGRALVVGVTGFVVVHLLALVVLGDPSLPPLVGVEALALAVLVAGDALATRDPRTVALLVVAVVATLVAVGLALGTVDPWVVATGLLAGGGGALYLAHRYDRSVAGGETA